MKQQKIVFILIFFLLPSILIISAHDEDLFESGNQFFMQEEFEQACQDYQAIEDKGFAVLYNLSLSYLKQNNRAQAILYGKRAELQANFYELTQLYELFDYIHKQNDPDYVPSWYEQIVIFLKKCILSISMLLLQVLLFVALILLMVGWYMEFYRSSKKVYLYSIFFFMFVMSAWWYKTNMMQQQVGIVIKKVISVYAGPDESFHKKSELHESDEVIIVSSQHGYSQVKAKQMIGWIYDKDVELV